MSKIGVDHLIRCAHSLIEAGKLQLMNGEGVMPAILLVGPAKSTLCTMAGEMNADARNLIIRDLISKHRAVAFVHFGDSYTRDVSGKLIGEALIAIIQLKDGPAFSLHCEYTRDPWSFKDVYRTEGGFWRPVWGDERAH